MHHIAWASADEDHAAWRERVMGDYVYPTEIIDRQYFHSIYFREPSGVLFEIATDSPGFATDEDPEHLGEALRLPPQHEPSAGAPRAVADAAPESARRAGRALGRAPGLQ